MTEITNTLIFETLKQIQALQAETNRKIGTLAEALVHQTKRIDHQSKRIDTLVEDVSALRADVRTVAIAVDEHSERLTTLEDRVNPTPLHS